MFGFTINERYKGLSDLLRCSKVHVSTELVVQFLKIFDNRFVVATSPTSNELEWTNSLGADFPFSWEVV